MSLRHLLLRAGALTGLLAALPGAVRAQDDVVLAGLRHGTVPPPSYFETLRSRPGAFQFSRGWMNRNPRLEVDPSRVAVPDVRVQRVEGGLPLGFSSSGPAGALGRRDGAVEGTFAFPLVLGYFSDSPAPTFGHATIQQEFFDGPSSRAGTIPEFYAELSGGRVTLEGMTQPWQRSNLSRAQVTGGVSGLGGSSQVGAFIVSVLEELDDGSIDWGQFDNDGPDGIPNSGDDDGFVDVLAVMHPTAGAECNGAPDRIWSHRWSLWSAAGSPYQTGSARTGGGSIRVNDYTIQPLLDCAGEDISEIGVFAHELGHGFGLPDLYCTADNCPVSGIGEWGLMGSGSWGCDGDDPSRPCHMSAWSKLALGWATVEDLLPGTDPQDFLLEPVISAGRVLRYEIPGTPEYYLLENRQPLGFDVNLHAPGLLIWHVNQEVVDAQWPSNRVNTNPNRYGVGVIQADAEGGLQTSSGNRGDDGDPFPGAARRTAFHAGSIPTALSHDGLVSGLTLTGLTQLGQDLSFRLGTRFHTVAVATQGDGGSPLLSVDGVALPAGGGSVEAAPFQRLHLEAAPGEEEGGGVRTPFLGWTDGEADRIREVAVEMADTAFTAAYGGREVQVGMTLEGGRFDVVPGTILSDPPSQGLWFPEGTAVTLTAQPTTGFTFQEWTGALAGAPNPVGLVVDAPVAAGATFGFNFAVTGPEPVALAAGDQLSLGFVAENATDPVTWRVEDGRLPVGVLLLEAGRLAGTPAETGTFTFAVRAYDALGLQGSVAVTLEVGVPEIPLQVLSGSLLGSGSGPTPGQIVYLDRSGNQNGRLDLGDVRVHLLRVESEGSVPPGEGIVERVLAPVQVGPPAGGRP